MSNYSDDQFYDIVKNYQLDEPEIPSNTLVRPANGIQRSHKDVYLLESERYLSGFLGTNNSRPSPMRVVHVRAADLDPEKRWNAGNLRVNWVNRVLTSTDDRSGNLSAGANADQTPRADAGFGLFYRGWWIVLALLAFLWGLALAGGIPGVGAIGVTTAATGTVVMLGLIVTQFVAGRQGPPAE